MAAGAGPIDFVVRPAPLRDSDGGLLDEVGYRDRLGDDGEVEGVIALAGGWGRVGQRSLRSAPVGVGALDEDEGVTHGSLRPARVVDQSAVYRHGGRAPAV